MLESLCFRIFKILLFSRWWKFSSFSEKSCSEVARFFATDGRTINTRLWFLLLLPRITTQIIIFESFSNCQQLGIDAARANLREYRGIVAPAMEMYEAKRCDSCHQSFTNPSSHCIKSCCPTSCYTSKILTTVLMEFGVLPRARSEVFTLNDSHPKRVCDRQISNFDLQPESTFCCLQFSRK